MQFHKKGEVLGFLMQLTGALAVAEQVSSVGPFYHTYHNYGRERLLADIYLFFLPPLC